MLQCIVILSETKNLVVGRKPQYPSLHFAPFRTTAFIPAQNVARTNPL